MSEANTTARETFVLHANARLTLHSRSLLVDRIEAGWPQARVAEQLGVVTTSSSRSSGTPWRRRTDRGGWNPGL